MKEYILKKTKKFKTKTFTVWEADLKLGRNKFTWEHISFNQADKSVMIAPLTGDNKLVLIKKFCPAVNGYEYVLPGGKVDKDSSLEKTAKRELLEETGYYPKKLIPLGPFKILPAYLVGTTYGFIAKEIVKKEGVNGDELESIKLIEVPFNKAVKLIKEEKIRDVRSVAIILYVSTFFPNLVS